MPWWTPACREAIRERNRAYRIFNNNPIANNLVNYKKCKAKARKIIKKAKRTSWHEFVSIITKDTPTSDIWKFVKRVKGKTYTSPVYLCIDNVLITDPIRIAKECADYFESVSADENYLPEFLNQKEERETPLDFTTEEVFSYNSDFTMDELLYVLGKVRGSSAGPDGIKYEMLQYLSPEGKTALLNFYNFIWVSQSFPSGWRDAITIPVHKPGKNPQEASSYRPIALTNVLCKVMKRLVNRRFTKYLNDKNILHPQQSGFRKGRNTYHNLIRLEHDIQRSLALDNISLAVFLDIEKAFDMSSRWGIMRKVHDTGLRGNLPIFIKNFIDLRYFRVKVNNTISSLRCQVNGVPQGSVLSPTLFLLMINDLLPYPPGAVKISFYADDVVIWISSHFLRTCVDLIQQSLRLMEVWSQQWGLRFSPTKTKAILFCRVGVERSLRVIRIPKELQFCGAEVEYVNNHRYLGLIFDRHLTWNAHIEYLRTTMGSKINILRAISGTDWGADRHTMLMLYRRMILPKMDYGSILYSKSIISHKVCDSVLKPLGVLQNECLRIATGALKGVYIPVLEVEADVPPLEHHFAKQVILMAASVLAVENHPLSDVLQDYQRYLRSTYQPFFTRAHRLAVRYNAPLHRIEPMAPMEVSEWAPNRVRIHLNAHLYRTACPLQLLQEALAIVASYPGRVAYYTDGSKRAHITGTGIYSEGYERGFRLPNNYSVLDAELYGIVMAMERITAQRTPSVIFTDSRSSLQAILSGESKHPLVIQICQHIQRMAVDIDLVWVPAHIGLQGNERADSWAKRALVYNMTTTVPISPRTLKAIANMNNRLHWQSQWDSEPRFKFQTHIGNRQTSFRRVRREEIAICRLRTGKTRLTYTDPLMINRYPAICDHCFEELNVNHIIVECLLYHHERKPLKTYMDEKNTRFTLYNILQDDEDIIDILIIYLRETGLLFKI